MVLFLSTAGPGSEGSLTNIWGIRALLWLLGTMPSATITAFFSSTALCRPRPLACALPTASSG